MTAAILLAGATGLIGAQVLDGLLQDADATVIAPVRRGLGKPHPRLREVIDQLHGNGGETDLSAKIAKAAGPAGVSAYLCCLGTTLKTAGSREAFSAVDLDLVLRLARIGRDLGATHATLVSSVGADAGSSNFYLAVKGRAEAALCELGYARVDLLRPSLLLGVRSEARAGEAVGQVLAPWLSPLLLGPLSRYRAISATSVARAALRLQQQARAGRYVHEYEALRALARSA